MPVLPDIIAQAGEVDDYDRWRRAVVGPEIWRALIGELAAGRATLLGLWGDRAAVFMAVTDAAARDICIARLDCADGKFPSVGAAHAPAIRLERAIRSLYGLEPVGALDTRPWLDLGFWGLQHPLGARPKLPGEPQSYQFLPAEGENLHQIPVGPVHAGIIEPGHFRFTASGETVVRLEQRLGYVHKGIESLMRGATPEQAARLAGRTSGDSTVAYALAFAHAVESALQITVPPRAQYLRALMAELERLANHFGDIGAICNDASFPLMQAHCGILRERVLRAADACCGHRLMMDAVIPGGVARDLAKGGAAILDATLAEIRRRFSRLVELYDNTASLQDRTVQSGVVRGELVQQFGAGGYIGRASGRNFDARKAPGYAPYDRLEFDVPVLTEGDVNARVWVRIREVEQSLRLVDQILGGLPAGALAVPVAARGGICEGCGLVEGFRGDILAWVQLDGDRLARCHLRDPSWFQWPLLEAAIEGNIIADFPLCNKSFNCSYSGHDL